MKTYNENIKFIYDKPKKLIIIMIFYLILFLTFLYMSCTQKIYSHINTKAIISNKTLIIPQTLDNINKISNSNLLKIDSKYQKFKIIKYGEVYNEGNINLQDLVVSSNVKNKKDNQIIDVTFYYDKELIIKKILKGVFK